MTYLFMNFSNNFFCSFFFILKKKCVLFVCLFFWTLQRVVKTLLHVKARIIFLKKLRILADLFHGFFELFKKYKILFR